MSDGLPTKDAHICQSATARGPAPGCPSIRSLCSLKRMTAILLATGQNDFSAFLGAQATKVTSHDALA